MKILLGSNSPRRNELLKLMGLEFDKVNINCNEDFSDTISVSEVAESLAIKKSNAFEGLAENELLITADTTVVIGDEILNKPADKKESISMLKKLSGNVHSVITGVCLKTVDTSESFSVETKVSVGEISLEDMDYYIEQFKPYDKAGSYGIQEWFGMTQVSSVSGCYYNVVGLPCSELFMRLRKYI